MTRELMKIFRSVKKFSLLFRAIIFVILPSQLKAMITVNKEEASQVTIYSFPV